jgi:hypothetical protein
VAITRTGATGRIEVTGVASTELRWYVISQRMSVVADEAPPNIASVTPGTGDPAGGEEVVIAGSGFTGVTGASGVTFGGTNATSYTVDSDTQITATVPAHAAGVVDVVVTHPTTGASTGGTGAFEYAVAFDPLSVGTPIVWIDSTDVTEGSPGQVSAVTNKAGGGATLTINAGKEPTLNASNADYANAPTIDCGSAQGIFLTTHGLTTGAFTVVIVGDGQANPWFQDASGNYLISAGGGSGDDLQITGNAATYLSSANNKSGVPGCYAFNFNTTASKIFASAETESASGSAGNPMGNLTGVTIGLGGTYNLSGAGMQGSIRHLLIYSGVLSNADIAYLLNGFGDESGIAIGP